MFFDGLIERAGEKNPTIKRIIEETTRIIETSTGTGKAENFKKQQA